MQLSNFCLPSDDLLSQGRWPQLPSALESLTSVFGMGTGVASPLESPGFHAVWTVRQDRWARARKAEAWLVRVTDRNLRVRMNLVWRIVSIPSPLTPGQLLKRSSPRPLVPLSFIRHRTSTCGLSNRWSPCGLTRLTRWGTSSRGELRT